MEARRKWEEAPLNTATDWELSCFLASFDTGMSKPHYELGVIYDVTTRVYIRKSEVVDVYFDDILNNCTTKEEVDEYVKELVKEWG